MPVTGSARAPCVNEISTRGPAVVWGEPVAALGASAGRR